MTRSMELQCGAIGKARRSQQDARASAVEAPRPARDFIRRAGWPQEGFPNASLPDVEGPVNVVTLAEIEAHDRSLTPAHYVGVTPEDEGEDFDFNEAVGLATRIAQNLEELGT